MLELLVAGRVRMEDVFARAEEKAWLLERTKDLHCLLYTSPSPRDRTRYRMPYSA